MCLNSHVFFVFFYVAIQLKAICTLVLQVLKLCINRFLLYIMWSDFFKCPVDRLRCSLSSVQSLSRVRLFANPWIAARQASLSITNSQSSLRLTSIESVMPSSHLILCRPLHLLPSIPPASESPSLKNVMDVNTIYDILTKNSRFVFSDQSSGI